MEREHLQEWTNLQAEALARLRSGTTRGRFVTEVRGVVIPSFSDAVAYEIMLPNRRSEAVPLGIKTLWASRIDAEKFSSPVERLRHGPSVQPTIHTTEIPLPSVAVDELLTRCRSISVPIRVSSSPSLDGTGFELTVGGTFGESCFTWSNTPPQGWEPLQELLAFVEQLIEGGLTSRFSGPA